MFKKSLTIKLFLVLLLTVSVVVLVILAMMRLSFHRGFTDYINQLDETRLERVAERLEDFYDEAGGWELLRERPHLWRELMRGINHEPPPDTAPRPADAPPQHRPGMHDRPPLDIWPRLSLFDAQKQRVAGRAYSMQGLILYPLKEDDRVLGWLGLRPLEAPSSEHDVAFLKRQAEHLYLIAGVVLLVAALASLLLARRLLIPIRALAQGARGLARGEYETRVPAGSRDELGRLAGDFNHLAETLAANESARRRWIADISHELRTPLSVLRGEIEALQDGIRPCNEQTLQSLHQEAGQLSKLVDDLYQLSLSDLGALNYHQQEIELRALLQQVIDSHRGRFADAGIELAFAAEASEVRLLADPDRLTQLFDNLLENSLRYTDAGGRAVLRCRVEAGQALIDVEDSAPGVPDEALPHLFERLYRVDASRNRSQGGAGLGLSIAWKIVEAHQGRIEARPSALGGLWLRVHLPLEAGDAV